jgi:hypothetical protein
VDTDHHFLNTVQPTIPSFPLSLGRGLNSPIFVLVDRHDSVLCCQHWPDRDVHVVVATVGIRQGHPRLCEVARRLHGKSLRRKLCHSDEGTRTPSTCQAGPDRPMELKYYLAWCWHTSSCTVYTVMADDWTGIQKPSHQLPTRSLVRLPDVISAARRPNYSTARNSQ